MTNIPDWRLIGRQIESIIHQAFEIKKVSPVSGGCINSAYILHSDDRSYFIKINNKNLVGMFEAEFAGLEAIAQNNSIKVPQPLLYGCLDNCSFLVLENLSFGRHSEQSDRLFGQQLAALHQTQQPYFGWTQDNTIGSTPQINPQTDQWVDFWRQHRLGYQLKLAESNGYTGRLISSGLELSDQLAVFFTSHTPHPALLHGDLWGGNAGVTNQGIPVIFDPACYFGDREADIAMTELFGGFGTNFYHAYEDTYPLDPGYSSRKKLYNLYHILNHLNLFGEGYRHQAQNLIDALLSEIS